MVVFVDPKYDTDNLCGDERNTCDLCSKCSKKHQVFVGRDVDFALARLHRQWYSLMTSLSLHGLRMIVKIKNYKPIIIQQKCFYIFLSVQLNNELSEQLDKSQTFRRRHTNNINNIHTPTTLRIGTSHVLSCRLTRLIDCSLSRSTNFRFC